MMTTKFDTLVSSVPGVTVTVFVVSPVRAITSPPVANVPRVMAGTGSTACTALEIQSGDDNPFRVPSPLSFL